MVANIACSLIQLSPSSKSICLDNHIVGKAITFAVTAAVESLGDCASALAVEVLLAS